MSLIEPTDEHLVEAREYLAERTQPGEYALHYLGAVMERFAGCDIDADAIRRAVATYRVWNTEFKQVQP